MLPQFNEGERYIAACTIQNPEIFPMVYEALEPEDFSDEYCRDLFVACTKLTTKGAPIEVASITLELKEAGCIERWQGDLIESMDHAVSPANLEHYIREVLRHSKLRKLIMIGNDVKLQAIKPNADPDTIASDIQSSILSAVNLLGKQDCVSEREAFSETWHWLKDKKAKDRHIATGFYDLDNLITGLTPGDIYVVCARPGVGKTAFKLDVALHASKAHPVFFYSLEMNRLTIMARIISKRTGIPAIEIIHRRLQSMSEQKLDEAVDWFTGENLWIDTSIGLTPAKLQAKVASQSIKIGQAPQLIVVDYLQYMRPDGNHQSREREVASISTALKEMSLRFECPILVGSQLNRQLEGRPLPERKPKLSDLRESGSIEQDASVVIGLYRKDEEALASVLKNRNGALGDVVLRWDGPTTSFKNATTILH